MIQTNRSITPTVPPPAVSSRPAVPLPLDPSLMQRPAPHDDREDILFVGDSVAQVVDKEVLNKALRADIRLVEADVAGQTRNGAYSEKSFENVTNNELANKPASVLILNGGAEDISSLDTKSNPSADLSRCKNVVRKAAKNLFTVAENALAKNLSLKKVIIIKAIPRTDPKNVDPKYLKPGLVQVFNCALVEFWMESLLRDKIVIAENNLECSGGVQEARYRNNVNSKYDGVHLFGPSGRKAYSCSVLDILKANKLLKNSLPAKQIFINYSQYPKGTTHIKPSDRPDRSTFNREASVGQQVYTIPTSNRFEHLNL